MSSLAFFPIESHAGWVLYDNFKSGKIDLDKWTPETWHAQLSIKSEKLKIVQESASGGSYGKLSFKNSDAIKGIKLRAYVVSSEGDFRARIAGRIGTTANDEPVWQGINILPSYDSIWAWVDAENPSWLYNFFKVHFQKPINTIGKWYTLSVVFSSLPKITFSVSGQGDYTFTLPEGSISPQRLYFQIGTRSFDGTGAGTAYFDNVYILK